MLLIENNVFLLPPVLTARNPDSAAFFGAETWAVQPVVERCPCAKYSPGESKGVAAYSGHTHSHSDSHLYYIGTRW